MGMHKGDERLLPLRGEAPGRQGEEAIGADAAPNSVGLGAIDIRPGERAQQTCCNPVNFDYSYYPTPNNVKTGKR
jgi:hypothetical protein